MQKNDNNFLDPKTILAIALVGLVWFGWQSYLTKKYPPVKAPTQTASEKPVVGQTPSASEAPSAQTPTPPISNVDTTKEELIPYENQQLKFEVSSRGFSLKNVTLKNYTDRNNNSVVFGSADGTFRTAALNSQEQLNFSISKAGEGRFVGVAQVADGKITKELSVRPDGLSFDVKISYEGSAQSFQGIQEQLQENVMKIEKGSFLLPSFEHQDFVTNAADNVERINITSAKDNIDKTTPNTVLLGIGSQYFVTAMLDRSPLIPESKLVRPLTSGQVQGAFVYKMGAQTAKEVSYVGYLGPKSYSHLKNVDPLFTSLINYGFFSGIAKLLLLILQWCHQFLHNWGLAIIVLTILVRLVVLPFNVASYKSMKKMQKIQPMITSLRERYKDDPQTLQKEMMSVMRDQKVNPLGGCLPLLLQMPVFFALYQVLGQSIELYKAPFFFWIHDLSLKDPFYVLPVLMGISMFIQQKITPNPTMDPTQAKILQFLPIVFALMMISLPSGLTLYIFVSTLFGIIQQQIFMRDRTSVEVVRDAKT